MAKQTPATKFTEFFPGELFPVLLGVIKNNSDVTFVGTVTGKCGGYYAVFSFENAHGKTDTFETFVGYTKAQRAKFPTIGVYHSDAA